MSTRRRILADGRPAEGSIPPEPHDELNIIADFALGDGRWGGLESVSARREGPYRPLSVAIVRDPKVRVAFACGLDIGGASAYERRRAWQLLGLIPMIMLAELDRELTKGGVPGAAPRLLVALVLISVVAMDIARTLPRHPRATALVFAGTAARFALLLARSCAHGVHAVAFAAPVLAAASAAYVWLTAPTPHALARAIARRIHITAAVGRVPRASRLDVFGALLAAAGLPLALVTSRLAGLHVWWQAAIFVAYAALVPFAFPTVRRAAEEARRDAPSAREIAVAAAAGLALTIGLTSLGHFGIDAAALTARCVAPSWFDSAARQLLAAENAEVSRNVDDARQGWALLAMTVLVVPVAEERIYRGLLQRALGTRVRRAWAIAVSAIAFGLAHLGVYRVAVYQTMLLGVAFGAAFEEGGIIAAVITHAAWNFYLVL